MTPIFWEAPFLSEAFLPVNRVWERIIRAPALRPYKGWAGAPLNWLPLPKDPFVVKKM